MLSIKCGECSREFDDVQELSKHYREEYSHNDLTSFRCAYCNKRLQDKRTLVRHIVSFHLSSSNESSSDESENVSSTFNDGERGFSAHSLLNEENNENRRVEDIVIEPEDTANCGEPILPQEALDIAAVNVLVDLRSTASLTGKAIERFEKGCSNMIAEYCSSLKVSLSAKLAARGLSQEAIDDIVSEVQVDDPFRFLKTIDDQLEHFREKFGLVTPEEKYLDHRTDKRLDPKLNAFLPTQVNETFQYVSITETLKAILSDKKMRNLIFKDVVAKDGVLTSYVDGSHFKDHPFLLRHRNVLHILLYYDELEITNSLGSKTIIHKLGAFFYQVLNLPADMLSKMSSIHLLCLVNSDDMKKPGAFKKVLTPFIQEMKKLSSDEGVKLNIPDEEFILHAVLEAVTADNAAAHELCGFLAAGARHFCRRCMVSRAEIRANPNARGTIRTKELHQHHLEQVERSKKFRTQCGVKGPCPLDSVPFFSCVENTVFDVFHELLEGIVPLVLKLVLREFIIVRKLFSCEDLNGKIASFTYGVPDAKNKPSPNFVDEMFTKQSGHLKQTGSQMWCLARCLPFIIADYLPDEVDPHMKLLFLLQDIMQILFSFEIPNEDVEVLDKLIFDHNQLFFQLYIEPNNELLEEDLSDPNEGTEADENEQTEEDIDDPTAGVTEDQHENEQTGNQPPRGNTVKALRIYVINKLHQLTHMPGVIRQYGPPVRMWCAKFEGRLKIFRQHSAVCCNFKNPPKTMAKMFQLSNLKSIRSDMVDDDFEHQKTTSGLVKESIYRQALIGENLKGEDEISYVNSATVKGEVYRPGLFVCLPGSARTLPDFALIHDVILVREKSVVLLVKRWKNLGLNVKFNTFNVCPEDSPQEANYIAVNVSSLAHFRCIAPWCTRNEEVHLSMRTVLA